jgi:transposase-like protein
MENKWNNSEIELFKRIAAKELNKFLDALCEGDVGETLEFKFKAELIEVFYNVMIKTEFELLMMDKSNQLKKNGFADKKINTELGALDIKYPRDRHGNYYPSSIPKYTKTTEELSNVILILLQFGLSTRDITIFLEQAYGLIYSKSTMSNYSNVILEKVDEYKISKLDSRYIALYLDATYIPIKFENEYQRQALHLVVAINKHGYQEIIGYKIGFVENTYLWGEVLDDLKSRGVETVDIIISDGFVGLEKIIKSRFPASSIQRCTVHVLKNIRSKVQVKDQPAIVAEFSNLFKMSNIDSFTKQLDHLKEKYTKYESMISATFSDESITTYLQFDPSVQKTFRTSNRIESVNQKLKTRIKFRQQFPSVESFEKILVSSIIIQNNYFDKLVHGMKDYIK